MARGAAYLDIARPFWFFDIDLVDFDIVDCQRCVLGQLTGNYYEGLLHFGFSGDREAEAHGFILDEKSHNACETSGQWDYMWVNLKRTWKDEIIKRREEVTGMNIGEEQPAIVVEPIDVPDEVPSPEREADPVVVPEKEKVPA